jgi:bifunctional non-homologous end joining protein LigD
MGNDSPGFVPPMLATLVKALPEGPEWEYELKLDGYRLEAVKDGEQVRLYSRRGTTSPKSLPKSLRLLLESKPTLLFSTGKRL